MDSVLGPSTATTFGASFLQEKFVTIAAFIRSLPLKRPRKPSGSNQNQRQNQRYETKLTYSSGSVGNRGGQLRHRASTRFKAGQLPSRRLASRSRLHVRSDDGNLEPDTRSTGEGETDYRSSAASDHRHSSGRDAEDEGDHGQRDVADSSVAHTRAADEG